MFLMSEVPLYSNLPHGMLQIQMLRNPDAGAACGPIPGELGTSENVSRILTCEPRPESGLNWLNCSKLTRQRDDAEHHTCLAVSHFDRANEVLTEALRLEPGNKVALLPAGAPRS